MLTNKTTEKKTFVEDGMEYFIKVDYGMFSSSPKAEPFFSITGIIQLRIARNRWTELMSGAITEKIKQHFPHLSDLIPFHMHYQKTGLPVHYIQNALYFHSIKDWVKLCDHVHLPFSLVECMFLESQSSEQLTEFLNSRIECISEDFHTLMKKYYVEYVIDQPSISA